MTNANANANVCNARLRPKILPLFLPFSVLLSLPSCDTLFSFQSRCALIWAGILEIKER